MGTALVGAYQGPAGGKAAYKGEEMPFHYWWRRPDSDSMPDRNSLEVPDLNYLMLQVGSAAVDGG